jgi:hypothetical protein
MQKTPDFLLRILKNEIFNPVLADTFRLSKKHFTRNRKQNFPTILIFMMNFLRKSLSLEIENFVNHVRVFFDNKLFPSYTKSAFVQGRNKIHPEVYKHLSNKLIEELYTDNDESIKLWKGYRLLAADGSRMTLPQTKELSREYRETKIVLEQLKHECPYCMMYLINMLLTEL